MVKPLKKSSLDPFDLANYRPVSNIPFLGKVVVWVAAEELQAFLEDTSALDLFQFSFQPCHGVEFVLVTLIDDLHRQLDWGGSTLLLLLDLSATFNMVITTPPLSPPTATPPHQAADPITAQAMQPDCQRCRVL